MHDTGAHSHAFAAAAAAPPAAAQQVCCITKDQGSVYAQNASWVVWGAGTQGRAPKPPLTRANHCANVVATAGVPLPELLSNHFK